MNKLLNYVMMFGAGLFLIVVSFALSVVTENGAFIILLVVGVPFFLAGIVLSICEGWFWTQFRKIFGTQPPRDYDEEHLMRALVDKKLSHLAVLLQSTFNEEVTHRNLLQEAMYPKEQATTDQELTAQRKRLHQMQENLKLTIGCAQNHKKRFWRAHRIAKHFGFAMRSSYKEYLPVKRAAEQTA